MRVSNSIFFLAVFGLLLIYVEPISGACGGRSQGNRCTTAAPTTAAPTLAPTTAAPTAAPTTSASITAASTTSSSSTCPLPRSDGKCGFNSPDGDNAPCNSGECCSSAGLCGSNSTYCNADSVPTCQRYMAIESCGDKTIALTFDDGPNFATPTLIAAVKAAGVPATVFVNQFNWGGLTDGATGTKCQALQNATAAGIEIQSHSKTHVDFATSYASSNSSIYTDLRAVETFLSECGISAPVKFFRPPYGSLTQAQAEYISQHLGYVIAYWNGMAGDTESNEISYIESRLLGSMPGASTGAGALVLAHDHAVAATSATITAYIQYIKDLYLSSGYRFVTMSECWSTCTNFKSGISGKLCTGTAGSAFSSYMTSWN